MGAAGHEALARRKFDVVVVDEATQLLLPTALGGLFKLEPDSSQFVLVGDDNQLPPLVQSNVARFVYTNLLMYWNHLIRVNTLFLGTEDSEQVFSPICIALSSVMKTPRFQTKQTHWAVA